MKIKVLVLLLLASVCFIACSEEASSSDSLVNAVSGINDKNSKDPSFVDPADVDEVVDGGFSMSRSNEVQSSSSLNIVNLSGGVLDREYSSATSSSSVEATSSAVESSASIISSAAASSSSVAECSSSKQPWPPENADAESVYDSKANTLTDLRDGQVYKTKYMYSEEKNYREVWMDQNLNYAYMEKTAGSDSSSFCYDNDPINCKYYGRLYMWSAAIDSAAHFSEDCKNCGHGVKNGSQYDKQRGACPKGWHVPAIHEFNSMNYKNFVFSKFEDFYGGIRNDGAYTGLDIYAVFWTTGELDASSTASYQYRAYSSTYSFSYKEKSNALSLRCIMDDDFDAPLQRTSNYNLNPDIVYGTLVDGRDDFVYKTIDIYDPSTDETITWMAENLSFDYDKLTTGKSNPASCASYEITNCERYGRRYSWYQTVDTAGVLKKSDENQGICPNGWRMPTQKDFATLIDLAGGTSKGLKNLKSTTAWYGIGVDSLGFSAVPFSYGEYSGGEIWSISKYDEEQAYALSFSQESVYNIVSYFNTYAFVRCIKKTDN